MQSWMNGADGGIACMHVDGMYVGGYDKEEKAARAYDLAALKYWGPTTTINFPVCKFTIIIITFIITIITITTTITIITTITTITVITTTTTIIIIIFFFFFFTTTNTCRSVFSLPLLYVSFDHGGHERIPAQLANYEKELEEMKLMTKQEFVASLRRFDCVFSLLALQAARKRIASSAAIGRDLANTSLAILIIKICT
jgi:hypothetical protein